MDKRQSRPLEGIKMSTFILLWNWEQMWKHGLWDVSPPSLDCTRVRTFLTGIGAVRENAMGAAASLSSGASSLISHAWHLQQTSSISLTISQYFSEAQQIVFTTSKKSGNFGWTVNGKAVLVYSAENFQNKRNVPRESPKSSTGISEQKIVFHLLFSTSSRPWANGQASSRLSL